MHADFAQSLNDKKQLWYTIWYVGPPGSGKATNLRYIHSNSCPQSKAAEGYAHVGEFRTSLIGEATVLSFDYLDCYPGLSFSIKTATGMECHSNQIFMPEKFDGIVFVADSDQVHLDANKVSLRKLAQRIDDSTLIVFQYNKMDLSGATKFELLDRELNHRGHPAFEAVASEGYGVFRSFSAITALFYRR